MKEGWRMKSRKETDMGRKHGWVVERWCRIKHRNCEACGGIEIGYFRTRALARAADRGNLEGYRSHIVKVPVRA
jgi:hypothetical protein